jgi:chromatin remodeling complex protein RSC6
MVKSTTAKPPASKAPASKTPASKAPAAKAKPAAKEAGAMSASKAPGTGAVAKKAAGSKTIKPPRTGAPNALQTPLKPSAELAAIVGADLIPRGEVVSKIWTYIKEKNLQNPANKREILADDKLGKVFGTDKVTMFEMNKHLARHLS